MKQNQKLKIQKEYRRNIRKTLKAIIQKSPQDMTEEEILAKRHERIERRKRLEEERRQKEESEENKENEFVEEEVDENLILQRYKQAKQLDAVDNVHEDNPQVQKGKKKKKKSDSKKEKKSKIKKKVSDVYDYEIDSESSCKTFMAGDTGLPTFFFNKIEKSVSVFQQVEAKKKLNFKQVSLQFDEI